jgi:DNA-binding HxlR family transcriptional regulator
VTINLARNGTATPGRNGFDAACPTHTVLITIAEKWATYVIELLGPRPQRFGALRRSIGGVSQKMLTQTLRRLERDGLVRRRVHPTRPPSVEYALTPLGHSLLGPIVALRAWAETNVEQVLTARAAYDAQEVLAAPEPGVGAAEG